MTTTITITIDKTDGAITIKENALGAILPFTVGEEFNSDPAAACVVAVANAFNRLNELKANPPATTTTTAKPAATTIPSAPGAPSAKKSKGASTTPASKNETETLAAASMFEF